MSMLTAGVHSNVQVSRRRWDDCSRDLRRNTLSTDEFPVLTQFLSFSSEDSGDLLSAFQNFAGVVSTLTIKEMSQELDKLFPEDLNKTVQIPEPLHAEGCLSNYLQGCGYYYGGSSTKFLKGLRHLCNSTTKCLAEQAYLPLHPANYNFGLQWLDAFLVSIAALQSQGRKRSLSYDVVLNEVANSKKGVTDPGVFVLYDLQSLFFPIKKVASGQIIRWNCSEDALSRHLLSRKIKLEKRGGLTLIEYWNALLPRFLTTSSFSSSRYVPILNDTYDSDKIALITHIKAQRETIDAIASGKAI